MNTKSATYFLSDPLKKKKGRQKPAAGRFLL